MKNNCLYDFAHYIVSLRSDALFFFGLTDIQNGYI